MLNADELGELLYEIATKLLLVCVCFVGLQRLGTDVDEGFSQIGMSVMLFLRWIGVVAKIPQKMSFRKNRKSDFLRKNPRVVF